MIKEKNKFDHDKMRQGKFVYRHVRLLTVHLLQSNIARKPLHLITAWFIDFGMSDDIFTIPMSVG